MYRDSVRIESYFDKLKNKLDLNNMGTDVIKETFRYIESLTMHTDNAKASNYFIQIRELGILQVLHVNTTI